ncbi:MAG: acylneuraminate cytidylyltransferase family protein [Candidatus Harrisonbacteria bacterium]|nr:acylneuraminate cytidylyltransferase family protein [Candidatus Harrisonbacteria bacterium]
MKNICLIPARGGSKRIPKKNIVDFHGKPMIAHTIEAAIKSGLFGDSIYISSDSEEILNAADSYKGVKKILRPAEISGDKASLEDVTAHLLKNVKTKFDYLCLLMPNCPLRNSEDVKKSYEILRKLKKNCLMSVVDYYWLYPFWALEEKNGRLDFFFGKKYLVDSKKLPKVYCPSGAVRWVKVANFLKEKKYYGKDLGKYVIPFERSVDIDTFEDLELAKKLFKIK